MALTALCVAPGNQNNARVNLVVQPNVIGLVHSL